jgi:two-component system CheB/CheR fusion protein
MARRNVELESRLIDDLLDVTRIARGRIELSRKPIDLRTIIQRAVEVCTPDIEARHLHFGTDFQNESLMVQADAARLQQVFWNLLKNAVKFTPHDGNLAIRAWRHNGHAMVEVSDSGAGIEPESISKIFNAFEQAQPLITRHFGGLGLGLAISKALVEMHGGTIVARSDGRDRGATFTVQLPIAEIAADAPDQPSSPASAARAASTLPKRNILYVEDHGDTARILSRLLCSEGHTVERAGDVETALNMATSGNFDLLISDIGLPDGTGHDLMRELRSRGNTIPGIALSGYGMASDIAASREAGFFEHLTKPTDVTRLLEAIDRATTAARR